MDFFLSIINSIKIGDKMLENGIFKNYDTEIKISIQSSNGTVFYYDMGEITLTCSVEGGDPANEYSYHWTFEDSRAGTTFLENDTNIIFNIISKRRIAMKRIISILMILILVFNHQLIKTNYLSYSLSTQLNPSLFK